MNNPQSNAATLTYTTDSSLGDIRRIAKEATIYGFPLVDSYRIQHGYFVDRGGPEFKAPWNVIFNNARVYTPDDKAIQTPNSDTPYSYVGADLRTEPLVFTVPAVDERRYYSLQFIDMYTYNFAYVGSRSTGNEVGSFLLAGPGWEGPVPSGIKGVIRCETEFAFVLYRTQLFEPGDIENVKAVQEGYKVEPLSRFLGEPSPDPLPPVDYISPLTPEQQKTSPDFFNILNFILQFCPTHPSEIELMARFAKFGIGAGMTFEFAALAPEMQQAVRDGMADAWAEFARFKQTEVDTGKRTAGDGFGTREHLQNDYLARMSSAALGIYGNSQEEALYVTYFVDGTGAPLNGSQCYELRLPPGRYPPVNAFWSLTLYELPASLLYANSLDRYLINSPMLPVLDQDEDGGITIHVQNASPGGEAEANWLPAPPGPFWVTMRLYWPKAEALDGRWTAPAMRKLH